VADLVEFYEFAQAVNLVAIAADQGDRHAQSVLSELYATTRNVRNAIAAGDLDWSRQLIQDAVGRALLRSALE